MRAFIFLPLLFQFLALLTNATYNLRMEKKILRAQLYFLFFLTILNLFYFYYKENLPDHYYEISYQNNSINIFSYYFFSVLSNFGYWCGIWVSLSLIVFSFFYTSIFNKEYSTRTLLVFLLVLPQMMILGYIFLPETLGEGLYFLINEKFSFLNLLSVLFLLSISLFYIVSEKNFFKVFKFLVNSFKKSFLYLKDFKVKNLSQFQPKLILVDLKNKLNQLISIFSERDLIPLAKQSKAINDQLIKRAEPKNFKISDNSNATFSTEVEIESDDRSEDQFDDSLIDESSDDFNDEEYEDFVDEEFISTDIQNRNNFFATEELINCISNETQNNSNQEPDDGYFNITAKAIEVKLKEFNITARIINVLKGPVVDTFELDLGPGVKVNAVTNRVDDLSLALKGVPIRMVYPMKGKTTIGVEVPRSPRNLIYLDEVLKSDEFDNSNFRLPIAMGKDAYGDAAVIDLASTPHLLVAGTTGAGKSVFINTMLVSLIIKLSPRKLRLIMIDPKQLELALYQNLPHLIMPVVTDSSIASAALLWAIDEMERRYSLLKDFAVKNIEGFNKKIKTAGPDLICKINKYYPDADIHDFELPYIVIVVDEFADLKLSKSGPAIENSISRLAAKARASGIHIVLATQRPSADVITGVIKANFPTRVAFRVTTNMDSRVIMDTPGAEKLLGKGDMLFKQGIETLRMHSAYVEEDEIEKLVAKLSTLPREFDSNAMEFLENNGTVDYDVDGISMDDSTGEIKDDKYEEAVHCVALHRNASASFLQRRLGVGYNRAANLIEEMERQGVVGPAQGSKSRKVLIAPPSDSTP